MDDTLLDYLNYQIKFLKGKDILTYYTPCDPSKDKEPLLNRELSDKWQPPKTVAQKDRLKEESKTIAMKVLAEGPDERNRRRKKEKKDIKVVRVIKKLYTVHLQSFNTLITFMSFSFCLRFSLSTGPSPSIFSSIFLLSSFSRSFWATVFSGFHMSVSFSSSHGSLSLFRLQEVNHVRTLFPFKSIIKGCS